MKSKSIFFLATVVATALLIGCGGESNAPVSGPTIHLAGGSTLQDMQDYKAAYWRDAARNPERPEPILLGADGVHTHAWDMAVDDNGTVYIVGSLFEGEWSRPVLWRDGELQYLPVGLLADEFGHSYAIGITLAGDSIHIVGSIAQADSGVWMPAHWINGELQEFLPIPETATGGLLDSVKVVGDDVYLAGYVIAGEGWGVVSPAYWKNGMRTDLAVPERSDVDLRDVSGTKILIEGNDIYVLANIYDYRNTTDEIPYTEYPYTIDRDCGIARLPMAMGISCPWLASGYFDMSAIGAGEQDVYPELIASGALIWKNGQPTWVQPMVDGQYLSSTAMTIHNGIVWIVGMFNSHQDYFKPYYWTDNGQGGFIGTPLSMPHYELRGAALGITTFESTVYIVGYTTVVREINSTPPILRTVAAYWANGDRVDLEPRINGNDLPQRWADSIVVTASN